MTKDFNHRTDWEAEEATIECSLDRQQKDLLPDLQILHPAQADLPDDSKQVRSSTRRQDEKKQMVWRLFLYGTAHLNRESDADNTAHIQGEKRLHEQGVNAPDQRAQVVQSP
jgi:hypothetical protein